MRNINEIINTINNWDGTFAELVDEFSLGEYRILFEEGSLDYIDDDYIGKYYYDTGEYAEVLYNFISDWLMVCIAQSGQGKVANNLFRLWSER